MSNDHSTAIERIYRRLLGVVGRGKVQTGNDTGAVQVLQLILSGQETRDKCYRLAEYGFTSMPQAGADAVMLFIGGDRSNGVVVATGDQRYRITMSAGECAIHDDQQQKVHIQRGGIVLDTGPTGNPITLNTSGSVNVNAKQNVVVSAGGSATLTTSGGTTVNAGGNVVISAGGMVQLGGAGGKKVVLDGDPVSTGGTVSATSTKVKAT